MILGPNPGGEWAAQPLAENVAHWYKLTISISNDCREGRFHVSPGDVVLYFATTDQLPKDGATTPTRTGLEFQPKRLQPTWVAPGDTLQGELVYRIWDNQYASDPNAMRPFLRVRSDFPCPAKYLPR